MERKQTFVAYCKAHAIQELEELKGMDASEYGCDLYITLTQDINVNGTATFSTYEAKEYIKLWWDEAADVYQYQKDNYGEAFYNPFESPEAFHVCMIIEGVRALLCKCRLIDEFWNEELPLTKKNINRLFRQIKAQWEIEF